MEIEKQKDKRPWWESFSEDSPYIAYLENSHQADNEQTVDFLLNKLELKAGSSVFDQCCGIGSLSLALAQKEVRVYGCDISNKMINKARVDCKDLQLEDKAQFFVADAFEYICQEPVDGAFNWYTSFGYSNDEDNLRMLQQAFNSLKPGGLFALDYPNIAVVLGKFKKSMVRRVDTADGTMLVTRESSIDARNGRLQQNWIFAQPDGQSSSFNISVKLYLPNDLCRMLEEVGFGEIELYGNIAGDWLNLETSRCIAIARRPR